MTDSDVLAATIEYIAAPPGGDHSPDPEHCRDSALLSYLVLEICSRGLLQEFGRLVLQTLLQNDIARLHALRAIKLASIPSRGGANDQG